MADKKIVQKIVLAGVVIDSGKILILQRNSDETVFPNLWELPSGKREPLEKSTQTLVRELKEEAGLDIEPIMPISVFDYSVEKPDEVRDSTQINFLVKSNSAPTVSLSSEHQNFAWITDDQIESYEISPETKKVIHQAFNLAKTLGL